MSAKLVLYKDASGNILYEEYNPARGRTQILAMTPKGEILDIQSTKELARKAGIRLNPDRQEGHGDRRDRDRNRDEYRDNGRRR